MIVAPRHVPTLDSRRTEAAPPHRNTDGFRRALTDAQRRSAARPVSDVPEEATASPTLGAAPRSEAPAAPVGSNPVPGTNEIDGRAAGNCDSAIGATSRLKPASTGGTAPTVTPSSSTHAGPLQINGTATPTSVEMIIERAQAAATHVCLTGREGGLVAVSIRFGSGAAPDHSELKRLIDALRRRGLRDINVVSDGDNPDANDGDHQTSGRSGQ